MYIISRALYDELQECYLDVRDNYSGRFMYGKECFAIDTNDMATVGLQFERALHQIIDDCESTEDPSSKTQDLAEDARDLLKADIFKNYKWDNMGLGYIIYFPNVIVSDPEE